MVMPWTKQEKMTFWVLAEEFIFPKSRDSQLIVTGGYDCNSRICMKGVGVDTHFSFFFSFLFSFCSFLPFFFILFFFGSTGVELKASCLLGRCSYHLSYSTNPFFCDGFFQGRVSPTISLRLASNHDSPDSDSWVASITGVSYWHLACFVLVLRQGLAMYPSLAWKSWFLYLRPSHPPSPVPELQVCAVMPGWYSFFSTLL
jgi:hypothetical protein